jgi:DNA modification methylase
MIRWSDDPRCLANAPTMDEFLRRLRAVFRNCAQVLWPTGVLAVLMGDHRHEGRYQALPFRTFAAAEAEGFELAAPKSSASATARRRPHRRSTR